MMLRYNYRVDVLPHHVTSVAKTFGCVRKVYNDGINLRSDMYKAGLPRLKNSELQTKVITEAKKTPERAYLAEVSSVALIQSLNDLGKAYSNFFSSLKGERKNKQKMGPPHRKKWTTVASARFTRNGFDIRPNGKLYLAKIGELKVHWSRPLPAEPSSVTLLRDASGRYFVSFVIDIPGIKLSPVDSEIGIDLGLSSYAVDSNGKTIKTPKFFRKAERRLRKANRIKSRRFVKGAKRQSKNYIKARINTAKIHARVKDQRHDFIHQLTTRIVRDNQAIYVEDLAVKSMMKMFGKSFADQSHGMFIRILEAKCNRYGRTFIKVGRHFPSTQKCWKCDSLTGPKGRAGLKIRVWTCSVCGTVHKRDRTAAVNILAEGRRIVRDSNADSLNACGVDVRPL